VQACCLDCHFHATHVKLTATNSLNFLTLLLELLSLPFLVVTNSTIWTHSIALVGCLLCTWSCLIVFAFLLTGNNTWLDTYHPSDFWLVIVWLAVPTDTFGILSCFGPCFVGFGAGRLIQLFSWSLIDFWLTSGLVWLSHSMLFVWIPCVSSCFSDSGCRVATLLNPLLTHFAGGLVGTVSNLHPDTGLLQSLLHLQREVLHDYHCGQRYELSSSQRSLCWYTVLKPEYQRTYNCEIQLYIGMSIEVGLTYYQFEISKVQGNCYLCTLGGVLTCYSTLGLHPRLMVRKQQWASTIDLWTG